MHTTSYFSVILYNYQFSIIVKQLVYQQPVLNSYSHKQLSVLNIASISNHLKMFKIIKNENRSKQFYFKKQLAWSSFLSTWSSFLSTGFFLSSTSSPFHFFAAFVTQKVVFKHSTLIAEGLEEFEDLEFNLLSCKSKIFQNLCI